MLVDRWSLVVVCCLLIGGCWLLETSRCLLLVAPWLGPVVLVFAVSCSLFAVPCSLFAVRRSLLAVCRSPVAV